ncbi:FMRFamide-activated amiloride-sensitive sodium channel-like [Argiope bruennichi]|uniref:FMRFamide-activated amiloride-sensitive sodium channel-like n=1 Tax=Argiope bruennichi TaxID=94029 RepID=UPI002494441A|nr:FMRFamide-activated amiloride-sensitive sodium channel-like [Argiope bruennichi]
MDPFVTFRYGNCITFNKHSNLHTSKIGVGSGLILKLELECFCYLPTTDTYGARILIHDPNEKPNPEEEGFNISPGYEILISMKKIITQRLPAPYKDKCMDYKKRTNGSPVSKNDCVRRCIQEKNFAECGCIDQTLGVMIHLKSCDATNETQSCCLHDVLTDMGSHGPPCNCPLPCSTFNYKSVLSRSTLPKGNSLIEMTLSNVYDNKCMLKQEKVRVNVYYSSMEEHIYKQHPKWLISEFLGFLGNEFGIWLGLSLMVVFEVIEKLRQFAAYIFITLLKGKMKCFYSQR